MLTIKKEQQNFFSGHFIKKFEDKMVDHVKAFFPNYFIAMEEQDTRMTIRYAVECAKKYGFDTQRNVCLYLNTMLLLGSNFDRDPFYNWVQPILQSDNYLDSRIDNLSEKTEEIFVQFAGPQQVFLNHAFQYICLNNENIIHHGFKGELQTLISYLNVMYPEKYKLANPSILQMYIKHAIETAGKYGITTTNNLWVYLVFMFLLGSCFDNDPQFSWANKILQDSSYDQSNKIILLNIAAIKHFRHFLR